MNYETDFIVERKDKVLLIKGTIKGEPIEKELEQSLSTDLDPNFFQRLSIYRIGESWRRSPIGAGPSPKEARPRRFAKPISERELAKSQLERTLRTGNHTVREHLQQLEKRTRTSGQGPSLSEVLMVDTPTGEAASKSTSNKSLMQPTPFAVLLHPFGPTLKEWEKGVKADCGPNWTREQMEVALNHGPHPSAMSPEALKVFKEDIQYQVDAGFCHIEDAEEFMKDPPPTTKFSPVAAIPQSNRRMSIILNLSFPVRRKG